nr:PrsW family intramembrane metalloprotease [Propionibacterium sp.]
MTEPALHARRRNGLPTGRAASGPLGRRVLLDPWTWVFVLFTGLYAACLVWQYQLLIRPVPVEGGEVPGLNWPAIRDSAKLAFPTLAIWIVLLVWLDRFRPQRPLFWWLALGWGGSVATAASLLINTWAAQQMNITGGPDPYRGARTAIFVAPFVEEATKASVLFAIAVAYRYRLVSKLSGVVLAALSAAGFAFTENIIYYARAIVYSSYDINVGDPEAALNRLVLMRGYLLAFGHPLFTMMIGVGLLVAVRTHSKVVRVLAPLVGYLAAALLHMLFNTGATFLQSETQQLLVYFLVVLPLVLTAAVWVVRQVFVEGRRHRERLADFVRFGWLTDADAFVFSRQRSRWRAALIALSRGWRCLAATLRLQRAVTELVYLRDAQVRGTVDAAGDHRARELLDAIAALRPQAVDDPRGERVRLPDVRGAVAQLRERVSLWRRPSQPELQPVPQATSGGPPVGSPQYSPVDPRWGPPRP